MEFNNKLIGHYFILLLILLVGFFGFWFFRYFRQMQLLAVLFTCIAYVFWGVIHHYFEGNLHEKIIIEYISVSVLGFMIFWFLLWRL